MIQEHVAAEDDAVQTHYFVGAQVRKAIEAIKGPMPEDLPTAPSIRALLEEKRRKRTKLKNPVSSDEQENLF